MADTRLIFSSFGDADEVERVDECVAAARVGRLLDHRPAPPHRPDIVLELRAYVEPVDGVQRWAVIAAYDGETVTDTDDEAAAWREYEATAADFAMKLYLA